MVFMNINREGSQDVMTINEVATEIKNGNISKIIQDEDSLNITFTKGDQRVSTKESGISLVDQFVAYGVTGEDLDASSIIIEIKQPAHG